MNDMSLNSATKEVRITGIVCMRGKGGAEDAVFCSGGVPSVRRFARRVEVAALVFPRYEF